MIGFGASPDGELTALRVTDVRDEAEGIRSFELRHLEGADLPPFTAGAHLQVEVGLPDGRSALRHYSLLGDPLDRSSYRIAVLFEADGRGGSRFMHECLRPGATVQVAPPENGFPLRSEAEHTVLIAGGIGITPILSMVWTLARQGRSYEVHYAARTPERMAFRREVEDLAGDKARFYFTHIERPEPLDVGKVVAAPTPSAHVYVCGPLGMIRAVSSAGEAAGWPRGRIHHEGFGPSQRVDDRGIEVHLERSDITVTVAPGETILDAILSAGVWAPFECRRGSCGSCMTRVSAGEPDHRDVCLSDVLRETYMCTCVSRARSSHLTLEL